MVEGVELSDAVVSSYSVARNFAPQEDEDPNVHMTSLDFHRNGERCVTSRSDGVMSMINCLSGTVAKTILTKRYGVGLVRFTHHPDCVIFSSANSANDNRIRYHSFFDNKFLRYYTGHTDRVTSLMMHPTADQFLSAGMDGTIRLWDIRNSDTTAIIRTDHLPVTHVCAAYDQEGVVFGVYTDDHLIRMYDARNYQEGPFAKFSLYDASVVAAVEPFLAHMQAPNLNAKKLHALDFKFSPDGNQLLVTTNRGLMNALDYTVKADAATTLLDKWEGWGTSLCWWANAFGDRDDVAGVFFTRKELVMLKGTTSGIPALGFNIARYNIGGSGKNVAMKESPNMPAFNFLGSFWLDWYSNVWTSKSWNWEVDAK
ncbi:histone H3 (Lys4) methyltransferase complex and RNA cleavage factor II complex, subunit SWD2 [Phytophthora cinnamomi]|uniref:histone H3 (Lys4) methyltransferase complex and RNA cleavage factor II complex, subunit SWD2 n=1 Tax=Phytophthora cinnamomi TaxID=4785 RepID=UPI003559D553|nr:histone H3 (Lys4) methyltransferase complex and RNA cleavage factor II complex, subunit SWD2 [Phytophthora cinnamomi]